MKIRILRESRGSLTTGRYTQNQAQHIDGDVTHASEEVQASRIEIALNIDRFLQRPFLTVGGEILPPDETDISKVEKVTDPKETNLLLYVYRGVDENGNLQDKQDVAAVNRELNERVGHFLLSLDAFDKKVLASDIDFIIQSMIEERSPEEEETHQSTHMLKGAPGHFDDYVFATRRRSVYKDTRAGKDFMLKRTPELKNIPEQHHFLFSMENLMGRVKQALGEEPDPTIPPLDAVSYDANYRLGDSTEQIEKERNYEPTQSEKSMVKVYRNLFMTTYSDPPRWLLEMPPEQQLELYGPYFETLLYTIKDRLEAGEYPKEFFDLEKIADNVPLIFFDKYEEALESYINGIEQHGFEPED